MKKYKVIIEGDRSEVEGFLAWVRDMQRRLKAYEEEEELMKSIAVPAALHPDVAVPKLLSEFCGNQTLVRIRLALGLPANRLQEDGLVQKVLHLVEGEKELRKGVVEYVKAHGDESVDELKYLLEETQWWDWDVDLDQRDR